MCALQKLDAARCSNFVCFSRSITIRFCFAASLFCHTQCPSLCQSLSHGFRRIRLWWVLWDIAMASLPHLARVQHLMCFWLCHQLQRKCDPSQGDNCPWHCPRHIRDLRNTPLEPQLRDGSHAWDLPDPAFATPQNHGRRVDLYPLLDTCASLWMRDILAHIIESR